MSLLDMQRNIKHVVHLMMENRGFDTLLGWLYADGARPAVNIPPLRYGELPFYGVQSGGETWQPDDPSFFGPGPYTGTKRMINRGNWGYCHMPPSDPGEPWDQVKKQIYGPGCDTNLPANKLMRGFWLNYNEQWGIGSTDDILATATPNELPVINTLARAFAVSDMWFASAPTETNPNRAFSLGGSSLGRKINKSFTGVPYTDLRTIFTVFNETGVSAKLYGDHYWIWTPPEKYFTQYMFPLGMTSANLGGSIAQFQNAVATDRLPVFTYLEPTFFSQASPTIGTDYHPPGSLYQGEKFLKKIYDTLLAYPAVFSKTLFIVTFDEHGGTYDHIPPPPAPKPDGLSDCFIRYGVRVPTLLITPWVAPGTVFRGPWYPGASNALPFDHTSMLATLMKWQGIPYSQPADRGFLRLRTAVAPTFESAIINQKNASWPQVSPYDCSIFSEMLGQTSMPRTALPIAVKRITNLPHDEPEFQQIVAGIEANVTTEEQLVAELRKLIDKYGDRPRE